MEPVHIAYRIKLSEQLTEVFDYKLDGKTFEIIATDAVANPPRWTELGFKQCSHCPLNPAEHPHCPVALQLHTIVERFHQTRSIDVVDLDVITEDRTISKTTALQNAISSMLGLVFPISGCPKTAEMKPLARFHVPMASEEETVFHVAGMYLLAQYFLNNKGGRGTFSFDGLIRIYEDLHILNKAIASRLQAVTSSDSVKNAITLLDMYANLIPVLLQDQLVEIRSFFSAYLPEGSAVAPTSNYLEQAKAFKLELIPTDEEKLSLEIEDAQADDEEDEAFKALPEWLRKSMPKEKPPLPKAAVARESVAVQPPAEKKKAVFTLPDDVPAKPEAGTANPDAKPEEDDGLKMIDFKL